MTNEEIITKSLDDAAIKYAVDNANYWIQGDDDDETVWSDSDKLLDAFKAGAEWRDAQIPKLPDNINKAAKEYAKIQDEEDKEKYLNGYLYNGFYAGAEWMAAQGETVEGSMGFGPHIKVPIVMLDSAPTFYNGHSQKVIVQIRKKEE